jgi:hypothetical protein
MTDPISFPVLAGATLTGAITFLYNRVGAVLDRRAGKTPVDAPEVIEGLPEPLQARTEALTDERVQRLKRLADALELYRNQPQPPVGDDKTLRRILGGLRQDLEAIYGVAFSFGDEQRNKPTVCVIQHTDDVVGVQRGIKARAMSDRANVSVTQITNTIHSSGEITGLEIDGTIG